MPSLKLEDFSDRELLHLVDDVSDGDGSVSAADVADVIGQRGLENPTRNVSIRFTWLKRYGVLDRDADSGRWRLTAAGLALINGKLRANQAAALEGLDDEKLLALMSIVGSRFVRADSISAKMMEREWRNRTATRKRTAR